MYIKSARITNIRSIEDFEINFENPAGWHVLIGDNGSGKSTIIRSLALALVGPDEAKALWEEDWRNWLSADKPNGEIDLVLEASNVDERPSNSSNNFDDTLLSKLSFIRDDSKRLVTLEGYEGEIFFKNPFQNNWGNCNGWFSVAYGPYRRFTGGDEKVSTIFSNRPKLGAHLSAFSEKVALTEPINWLIDQVKNVVYNKLVDKMIKEKYPQLTNEKSDVAQILENIIYVPIVDNIKKLINSSSLLPNNITLDDVSFESVFFKDGNENSITVNQLSDGYRSILSLTLELIRQLIRVYGEEAVFKNIRENDSDKMYIGLPGVVLIDEIDAHLHPTWQTKIGQWFLKYFPNLQFIVTTHSPLVCRAAEKGTIWKLAAPGSSKKSEQVIGLDRNRLIYGNVLDAYGTEEFGVVDNIQAVNKRQELIQLSKKQVVGKTTPEEENKLKELRAIFSTDAVIEL